MADKDRLLKVHKRERDRERSSVSPLSQGMGLGGSSSGLYPGGPGQAASGPSGWWWLIPMVCFFQLFLLYRWNLVSHIVLKDHRLLHRKARDVNRIQRTVATGALGGDPDALVRALVSNVTARLEVRESELESLSAKVLEREEQLAKMHETILGLLKKGGAMAGGAGGTGGTVVDGEQGFPPAKPVPDKCGRQKDLGRKGKVRWHPQPNRYLLVMCNGGQLSNRISCMRQHMLDAALLNRTLVLPSHGIDYNYDNLLNLDSPRTCFGKDSFMTLDEFAAKNKPVKVPGRRKPAVMLVDAFVCHVHTYQTAKACDLLKPKYEDLGIAFSKPIIPEFRTPSPWFKYKSTEVIAKFAYPEAQVIAFGNMFGVGGADHRFRGSAPLAVSDKCKYYVMPSRPIMAVAAGFVNTFMGSRYMALHLRRGDFYDHCVIKQNSAKPCFHPLRQVAQCLERRLHENPGIRMVYLSTNADELEVQVLRELLSSSKARPGGSLSLVRMPELTTQSWAEPLIKLNLHKEPEVVSLVEKSICVLSTVFYGTAGSTFTGDINRLRDWLLTSSCADANLCLDDEPSDTKKSYI